MTGCPHREVPKIKWVLVIKVLGAMPGPHLLSGPGEWDAPGLDRKFGE